MDSLTIAQGVRALRWALVAYVLLCLAPAGAAAQNVNFTAGEKVGSYLGDASLRTLYVFARDYKGVSACGKECLEKWPPFHQETVVPGRNVPNLFGTITREDGKKQTTFRGWPLYTFAGDKAAGDVNGDGVNGAWFVCKVPFYTVMVAAAEKTGPFLVGPEDRALYVAEKETATSISCTGDCLKEWTPFHVYRVVQPSTLALEDFTDFLRPDGARQIAYKGRPLYWFRGDAKMGDTNGTGVKGWSLAGVAK